MATKKIGDTFYNQREFYHYRVNWNVKKVDKVLKKTLKDLGIYERIMAAKIKKYWPQLVSQQALQYTAEINIINNRLYIKILSPALRHELSLQRHQILENIRQSFGYTELEDIVIF